MVLVVTVMILLLGCTEEEKEEIEEVLECGGLWEPCCDCCACDAGLTCDTGWREAEQKYAYECVECGKKGQPPCHVCGGYDPISLTCCTGKPEVKACEGEMQPCGYDEEYVCRECGCSDQRCCPGNKCVEENYYRCVKDYCVTWNCQGFINQCTTDEDCCIIRKCIDGECHVPCTTDEDCKGISNKCENGKC